MNHDTTDPLHLGGLTDEEFGELAMSRGPDNRWLDFSSVLQPLWVRRMPPEPNGASLRTRAGATIAVLTLVEEGVAIDISPQEIKIWSFTQFDENRDGSAPVVIGSWVPDYDGIPITAVQTRHGVMTEYKSLDEAIVSCTDTMAVQFAKARVGYASTLNARRYARLDSIQVDNVPTDQFDGVFHVNSELWNQEMAGQLGRFLLAWQWLELNLRGLMIKAEANGKPIKDIYKPSRAALTNRVESTMQRIDSDLCKAIKQMIWHRNNIIHGAISSRTHPGDVHTEAEIVHHDLIATVLISAEESGEERHVMVPVNSGIYTSRRIARLTHATRRLTATIADISQDESNLELHRQNKKSPSRQGRRGKRSRGKNKRP